MMRHHQRARRERHELPRDEEREGIVGQDDEVHAGKECRIERQHAFGRFLVAAIAKREQARRGAAEIDDEKKKRREGINAKMRTQPGQTKREDRRGGCAGGCRETP